MKHIRHRNIDDDDDKLLKSLKRKNNDDDGLSFGSLNEAQKKIYDDDNDNDNDSDSDDPPETTSSKFRSSTRNSKFDKTKNSKSKHAPSESSSKRPVSKIRKIEGLDTKSTLYQDIRFDAAFGKADLHETRKNYAFLDEYRQQEIDQLSKIIRDKKNFSKLSYYEQDEIKQNLQSLKSRLDTMKTRDLQHKILQDYKDEQMKNYREGKQSNPYFLKRSEQRKLLQKAKFESMKPRQREKVMERKRKRKLGKEFRELEFRQNQN
ncbi:rRNA biogenesis protein Rrp36p [[Candida] jaroonii]|uniref:rRNA biogenesis protein Rrp36p n=1 Tax=[Candida] jaroonii TaxID=467808 RepID=A0ACA9Y9N1_9ASCO|nr:rRNA biogenesis protein Rrp36p [[Candida] jaroonii]